MIHARAVATFLVNIFSSLAIVASLKWFYVDMKARNGPPLRMLIPALHLATSGATGWLWLRLKPKQKEAEGSGYRTSELLLISASFCAYVVTGNMSLGANAVGMYQMMKLLSTPLIVLVQFLGVGSKASPTLSLWHLASATLVVTGIGMATIENPQLDWSGLSMGLVSVIATVFYSGLLASFSSASSWDPIRLLVAETHYVVPALLFGGWINGEFEALAGFPFSASHKIAITASALLAAIYNISTVACYSVMSAATLSTFGHLKTAMVFITGWMFFDRAPSPLSVLGTTIAILGVVTFSSASQKRKLA